MTLRPCITCGELGEHSRCTDCSTEHRKQYTVTPKVSPQVRGYDQTWRKLSERARRLQPWCTTCGTDQNLTADHSPEAWRRREQGKPIRLKDISVECMTCNIDAGPARPGGTRYPRPFPTLSAEAKFGSVTGDPVREVADHVTFAPVCTGQVGQGETAQADESHNQPMQPEHIVTPSKFFDSGGHRRIDTLPFLINRCAVGPFGHYGDGMPGVVLFVFVCLHTASMA